MVFGGLLERERDLAVLSELLDAGIAGECRLALVEGPPGSGKSALLRGFASGVRRRDVSVLRASGLELERDYPFGVVRQLFEPVVGMLERLDRERLFVGAAAVAEPLVGGRIRESPARVAADGGFSLLHGLYWVLVGLSDLGPLVLLVDDLQWCDAPSLRFLAFALKRGEDLRALIGVARRDGPAGEESVVVQSMLSRGASILNPAPLTASAVATLLSGAVGCELGEDVVAEAVRMTEGTPLFVRELADALKRSGDTSADNALERLVSIAPAAVRRRVRGALAGDESTARGVAEAAAVLGEEVPLRLAASLADVDHRLAGSVADALVRGRILVSGEPLRFRHPLVREAVLDSIEPRARAAMHGRAARILIADGESPQRAAVHLLASDPGADAWVVATLRSAASLALTESAPEIALAALRRALREPPDVSERALVLKELGLVEAQVGDPDGFKHLEEAFATSSSLADMADAAGRYAVLLCGRGCEIEAEAVLDRVMAAVDDRERRLLLEADVCVLVSVAGSDEARDRLSKRLLHVTSALEGATPAERLLLGMRAHEAALSSPAAKLLPLVSAALGDGLLLAEQGPDSPVFLFMVGTLQWCDQLDQAERELSAAVVEARRRGAAFGFAMASGLLAVIARKRGRLLIAEAEARSAVNAALDMGWLAAFPLPLTYLLPVLIERGELAEADRLLAANGLDGPLPQGQAFTELLDARGELRLAQGHSDQGIADVEEFGRRLVREGDPRANMRVRWAKSIVPALVRANRDQEARVIAAEALGIALTFGQPRFIAAARRAQALAHAQGPDLKGLQAAAATFERIDAPLELAQALVDIGVTLRRRRQPAAARDPLRRALDLAQTSGARPLAEVAAQQLRAAGARPRRDRITGRDALTASEHRIAQLAIEGMGNRQIAQALFITRKTVESHLEHVFRKLDIHSRAELKQAMTGAERSRADAEVPA